MSRREARSDRYTQKILNGRLGDIFTKRFLKSKHVVMLSEGDYLSRLRIVVKSVLILPFLLFMAGIFLYYRFLIARQYGSSVNPEILKLYSDQKVVVNVMVSVVGINVFLAFYCIIVMLNLSMGKGTYIVTAIFNVFYIAEALFFGSFIFIFDWAGIIKKFKSVSGFTNILRSQWIYIVVYFLALICFRLTKTLFVDINTWNREWIRVDRYRKTEDRENAFIFKTWVTPGEIKARKLILATAYFLIALANTMDLVDILKFTNYSALKYIVLFFGYAIFIGSFVVPYSKWSLIFYWSTFLFCFVILTIGLYHIQNTAWKTGNSYEYSYICLVVSFCLSLTSCISYTWTIRNKEEVQAIVINEFESSEDFQKFLEENKVSNEQGMIEEKALSV